MKHAQHAMAFMFVKIGKNTLCIIKKGVKRSPSAWIKILLHESKASDLEFSSRRLFLRNFYFFLPFFLFPVEQVDRLTPLIF